MTTWSAHIVPYTPDGRVLMQLRTADAKNWPGVWALFGGHVEGDESHYDCVVRESREEIGLDITDAVHVGLVVDPASGTHCDVFVCPLTMSLETVRQQQTEGAGAELFSRADLAVIPAAPHCAEAALLALDRVGL